MLSAGVLPHAAWRNRKDCDVSYQRQRESSQRPGNTPQFALINVYAECHDWGDLTFMQSQWLRGVSVNTSTLTHFMHLQSEMKPSQYPSASCTVLYACFILRIPGRLSRKIKSIFVGWNTKVTKKGWIWVTTYDLRAHVKQCMTDGSGKLPSKRWRKWITTDLWLKPN